jgi:hypothetical protein
MNRAADNSSSPAYFRALITLQWLVLPVIGALYAISWNHLPARLATHFDLNHQPNGWMSREGSLMFSLVLAFAFAATGSLILTRIRKPDLPAWGLLGLFHLLQWIFVYASYSIISFNVEGRPMNPAPALLVGIGAAAGVMVLALLTHRGPELPARVILADETHASPGLAIALGLPAVAFAVLVARIPVPGLRVALALAVVMMIGAMVMAWSGFHYLFSASGVEVRTLGFRLRSIPASQIRSYAVDRWNALGGYGIRGVGNRRAYVWGNRGVRIRTVAGEVFLGHSEPERMVRDLDLVTHNYQGHEVPRKPG